MIESALQVKEGTHRICVVYNLNIHNLHEKAVFSFQVMAPDLPQMKPFDVDRHCQLLKPGC
jgi:hypothetical protein